MIQLDANILLWIQENLRNDFLNPIFKFITSLGNGGWLLIVVSIVLCLWKKTRKVGKITAGSLMISGIVTSLILKPLVARVRPYEVVEGLQRIVEMQKDYSFPSGHASASFAVAVVLFDIYVRGIRKDIIWEGTSKQKIFGIVAMVLAILIAFSRLYVGVHYPTDVICGIIVGWISAKIAEKIL